MSYGHVLEGEAAEVLLAEMACFDVFAEGSV